MENQVMDFRLQLVRVCYNSDHVSFLSRQASGERGLREPEVDSPCFCCHLPTNPVCQNRAELLFCGGLLVLSLWCRLLFPSKPLLSVLPLRPEGSERRVPGEGARIVHRGPVPWFARNVVAALLSLSQEKLKPQYLDQLPGQLKQFSLFLGKFSWFAGEKVGERKAKGYLSVQVLMRPQTSPSYCLSSSPLWISSPMMSWIRTACLNPGAWTNFPI